MDSARSALQARHLSTVKVEFFFTLNFIFHQARIDDMGMEKTKLEDSLRSEQAQARELEGRLASRYRFAPSIY